MSESIQHIALVRILEHRAKELIPKELWTLILLDTPESKEAPPSTTEGYRPDLYFCFNKILIVGEAKTSKDVERTHSKAQYLSYLKKCSIFEGKAYLLLAVPWIEKITATNLLIQMKKCNQINCNIEVLDNVGWDTK
ncbi:hypothetical protein [Desulfitobacterium sp. AusDCA]|uniref:hypothetical protein n=1 Tax=Desulfitobacterium sp. AusDCA TaxID=3240383 RepID=UPI003DA72C01